MKKNKMFLSTTLLAMAMFMAPIHGAESDGTMGLTFEGDSEKFITYEQNSAYENMAPGEERVQQITLTNEDYREMKFYVRSEYTNPLGEGVANEQIAYDIEFLNNGEAFYTGQIGGMTKSNMDSLENNYLLQTLKKGESTTVQMKIKVDGDSMDNTYQDTEGTLNLIFSVEYEENTPIEKVVTIVKKVPVINRIPGVSTGDTTTIGAILGVFAASIVVMIILVVAKLKKRKDEEHEKA